MQYLNDDVNAGAAPPSEPPPGTGGRPLTSEPYRGARIRNRRTGEVRFWVGNRYVGENSLERLTSQEREMLSQAQANAERFNGMLPQLDRFEELNREVPTGALSHRFGLWAGDMPRILGIDSNGAREGNTAEMMDEMRSITDDMTPDQRTAGSGSSSNLDVGMFRSALPNVGREGPANSRIIQRYRDQARDAQEFSEFLDWRWPQTGSLQGAQEEFNRYRQARAQNPRVSWRQYFGAGAAPPPQRGAAGQVEQWTRDPRTGRLMRQRR